MFLHPIAIDQENYLVCVDGNKCNLVKYKIH